MINRLEIHTTWNGLVQAWKAVWQASDQPERWRAFTPHCDRLLALARQQGLNDLEAAVMPLLDLLARNPSPGEAEKAALDRLLPGVFAVVRDIWTDSARRNIGLRSTEEETMPLVVMFARSADSVRELLLQMEHYGYLFRVFTDFRLGLQTAVTQRAAAVVIELPETGVDANVAPLIEEVNRYGLKWFALSERGDFPLRLQAVRHSAQGFFVTPLPINALVDAVDPLAYKAKDEPYRVLVLDDSATVLATIEKTLAQFPNIHVRTLRHPAMVLESLLDFSPDVLLLDFHMDGCNGLEVAKIIRQNKAFESIPIVYLTSETSEAVQIEAMRHGGDDFLTKPISQTQLANTVVSKSERYRGLRRLMVEDSLTGLYNHVKTKALLQQAILLADREKLPVSYAIIDIDHFKRVNDTYGHTVGDKVIKTLARFLKQRLRRADVVGRYGGEEFVVVLYNSTPSAAMEKIEHIRDAFGRVAHPYDDGVFHTTFSAGVAHYPAYPTMMELMVAADDALYASKRAGRNCVTLAELSRAG
ncbi:GGDEF domain-containing protein [Uliginosibacterium sp. H1]|uniref:GGDEF domain-containing protein n=1 Tax=Uliginosibacterium sp. H1 TaxID=3114757 RepID=UPI002E16C2CB|nr:diguanylate cyclase [Uliginosibacterium sp. H1]